MAIDVLAPPLARSRAWIDEAVFVVFLLLVFIGVEPFKAPDPLAVQLGATLQTGAGDALRQVAYLLAFGAIALVSLRRHGAAAAAFLPPLLLGLLAWCAVTALWSPEPGVSIRRAGLAAVLVISAMLSVQNLGAEKSLKLLRWVLLATLLINIVSVKFVATAVHQVNEMDPALVGNWRGVYAHKNIAGSVGAITALLFLFTPREKILAKLIDFGVVALSVFFTAMTHSKASLGLLGVAALAGGVYRIAWRNALDRSIALVAMGLVIVGAAVAIGSDQGALARLLSDPHEFTGRTQIWSAELAYIRDHPLFGAGFGTFAATGSVSPLYRYISGWVTDAANGHNGYLQLLVTIGGIGFVLAMAALVVQPAVQFWRREALASKAILFALFVFLILHNLMETDFLEGDGVTWVTYLLMLAMLADLRRVRA
jgi:O-antigen ligase